MNLFFLLKSLSTDSSNAFAETVKERRNITDLNNDGKQQETVFRRPLATDGNYSMEHLEGRPNTKIVIFIAKNVTRFSYNSQTQNRSSEVVVVKAERKHSIHAKT